MTPEGKVVAAIRKRVRDLGGDTRKCRWEGRAGAPDLLILLDGRHLWVEVKAPGKRPGAHQLREHERLRAAGCDVFVVDSLEAFEALL